jgi:hypothetical protein
MRSAAQLCHEHPLFMHNTQKNRIGRLSLCCWCCFDGLQIISEIEAAQQPWAGQGGVIAPASVFILPSKDVMFSYVYGGEDFEKVFEVRAVAEAILEVGGEGGAES